MAGEANYLDVRILGREYRVACSAEEREALQEAVQLVDGKMQDIAHKTKNTVPERVAVMAALNIAHEHLSATKGAEMSFDSSGVKRRIEAMDTRLNALLDQQELDI